LTILTVVGAFIVSTGTRLKCFDSILASPCVQIATPRSENLFRRFKRMMETVAKSAVPTETSLLLGIGDEVWMGLVLAILTILVCYHFLFSESQPGTTPGAVSDSTSLPESANQRIRSNTSGGEEGNCPVCLDELKFAIETNCGHVYCGACIFSVVDLGDRGLMETPSCPYCRQKMNMILPYFSQTELTDDSDVTVAATRAEILDKIRQYNRFYSGQRRSFREHLSDLPMLTRRMIQYFSTYDGIAFFMNARIVPYVLMTIVYALSPFDMVPESLFGIIGILDDLIVLIMCVLYVVTIYRNFAAQNPTTA